jgi:hypothetical protein
MTTPTDPRAVLKPCPFCGGEAQMHRDSDPRYPWAVLSFHMSECFLMRSKINRHRSYATETDAIAAWNTRHREQAACEGVDEQVYTRNGPRDGLATVVDSPAQADDMEDAGASAPSCDRREGGANPPPRATLPKPEQPPVALCPLCEGEGVVETGDGHVQRCDCQESPTSSPEASEQGEVTQEDRDAAADFVRAWDAKYGEGINDFGPSEVDSVWLRSGDHDDELIIQAMMRHRLTAIRTLEAEITRLTTQLHLEHLDRNLEHARATAAEAAVTHWQDKFAAATLQREEVEAKLAEAREVLGSIQTDRRGFAIEQLNRCRDLARNFLSPKEPS